MKKTIYLTLALIFGLSVFATSDVPIKNESSTKNDQSYVVSSLSNDGSELITLTITVNSSGVATVVRSTATSTTDSKSTVHAVGSNLNVSFNETTKVMSVVNPDLEQSLFYVGFELEDYIPSIQNATNDFTVSCDQWGCIAGGSCEPSYMPTGPSGGNVKCHGGCLRCKVVITPASVNNGGGDHGVFIQAASVNCM